MIDEADVRNRLAEVASRGLSLGDFEEWIELNSWNMHADSSPEAVHLVSSIHLLLSEYGRGDRDESDILREFVALLDNVTLTLQITLDLRVLRADRSSYGTSSVALPEVLRVPA